MNMQKLVFRTINDNDIPLLSSWLNQDYVKQWYEDPDSWLEEIRERFGNFAWIHHYIVMADTAPVGFCQYYDCYDARALEDWYEVDTRGHTFSIDYFIGDKDYLNKGYGKAIVAQLIELIMTKEKGSRIIVQPEDDNLSSRGVLTANGFIFDENNNYFFKILQ
ncbi:MAG: GNAT family N-acetyltransferase [Clostridia bacterium]|nr:GNAT family N-acetyltransferase [Clostridia bacterium]